MMRYDTDMYGKIFGSMFTGSMRGKGLAQLVFVNMLATCTENGISDKTPQAIADEIGFQINEVQEALDYLASPDPMSRSPLEEGRRVVLLDEHRNWGWRIVNHEYYRALNKQIERRYQWRESKRRSVDRFTKPTLDECQSHMIVSGVDPVTASREANKFINFYESKGWKVGKSPMVQWRSSVANWVKNIETPVNGHPPVTAFSLSKKLEAIDIKMKALKHKGGADMAGGYQWTDKKCYAEYTELKKSKEETNNKMAKI